MLTYIIRRLIHAVVILLLVTIIVFCAMRLLPGDPILMILSSESYAEISQEQIDYIREINGLDKPMATQYFNWLAGIAHGDLGRSIMTQDPVINEIRQRVPVTLYIGLLSFIIGNIIGIPAGVICAIRRGSWLDNVITVFANIGVTVPVFWLGYLLMYVFGFHFRWLPLMGYTSPLDDFWLSTRQLIMPVICLALFPIASNARQARSCMLEVMSQDYIRTAWSKGLRERLVVMRHALKNGIIPVITLSGMGLSHILGGSVLIETVFVIPGMGLLAVSSVFNYDYPYVQGVILVTSTTVLLVNLLVDLTYGWLDPRIRYG